MMYAYFPGLVAGSQHDFNFYPFSQVAGVANGGFSISGKDIDQS